MQRATARADELSTDELIQGAWYLEAKVRSYRPRIVAMLGISAYRLAFTKPNAILDRQEDSLDLAALWVLPSPSGVNTHYQLDDLAHLFGELRRALDA